jgi:hypothetical protein
MSQSTIRTKVVVAVTAALMTLGITAASASAQTSSALRVSGQSNSTSHATPQGGGNWNG